MTTTQEQIEVLAENLEKSLANQELEARVVGLLKSATADQLKAIVAQNPELAETVSHVMQKALAISLAVPSVGPAPVGHHLDIASDDAMLAGQIAAQKEGRTASAQGTPTEGWEGQIVGEPITVITQAQLSAPIKVDVEISRFESCVMDCIAAGESKEIAKLKCAPLATMMKSEAIAEEVVEKSEPVAAPTPAKPIETPIKKSQPTDPFNAPRGMLRYDIDSLVESMEKSRKEAITSGAYLIKGEAPQSKDWKAMKKPGMDKPAFEKACMEAGASKDEMEKAWNDCDSMSKSLDFQASNYQTDATKELIVKSNVAKSQIEAEIERLVNSETTHNNFIRNGYKN